MATRAAYSFDLTPPVRAALVTAGAVLLALIGYALARAALGLTPPDPRTAKPAILLHLLTVIPSVPLGMAMLVMRKGDRRHRWMGRLWMALMAITAASTFFITQTQPGQFSLIHILSVVTLIAAPRAIHAARTGRIERHKRGVILLYFLALMTAGAFTFLPGRLMYQWAFG